MPLTVTLNMTVEELHVLLALAGASDEVRRKAGLNLDECAIAAKWRDQTFFALHGWRDHKHAVEHSFLRQPDTKTL